jgi:mannose-6-phosphate isomerase-like protein (cupin superfamily)
MMTTDGLRRSALRGRVVLAGLLALAACREPKAPEGAVLAPMAAPAPAAAAMVADGMQVPWDLKHQRFVLKHDTGFQMLLVGPPQTTGMRSGHVVLQEGESMKRHSTGGNEEMLVFLEGKGRVVVGTETVAMEADQALYVPPKTEHEIHNDGPGPLRYVFTVAPAAAP